jgi:hypothetical protein
MLDAVHGGHDVASPRVPDRHAGRRSFGGKPGGLACHVEPSRYAFCDSGNAAVRNATFFRLSGPVGCSSCAATDTWVTIPPTRLGSREHRARKCFHRWMQTHPEANVGFSVSSHRTGR